MNRAVGLVRNIQYIFRNVQLFTDAVGNILDPTHSRFQEQAKFIRHT